MEMLKDLLTSKEKIVIASKYVSALKNYANIFNSKKQKIKHKYIYPIRKAGFTMKEAIELDFKVCKRMWSNCLNREKRNKGGKPKLKSFFIHKINSHLTKNSEIAANRFLKLQKENAMYRSVTISDAYNNYKYKENISLSTFYKYIGKKFKKFHRLTDLCCYCELNKVNTKFL